MNRIACLAAVIALATVSGCNGPAGPVNDTTPSEPPGTCERLPVAIVSNAGGWSLSLADDLTVRIHGLRPWGNSSSAPVPMDERLGTGLGLASAGGRGFLVPMEVSRPGATGSGTELLFLPSRDDDPVSVLFTDELDPFYAECSYQSRVYWCKPDRTALLVLYELEVDFAVYLVDLASGTADRVPYGRSQVNNRFYGVRGCWPHTSSIILWSQFDQQHALISPEGDREHLVLPPPPPGYGGWLLEHVGHTLVLLSADSKGSDLPRPFYLVTGDGTARFISSAHTVAVAPDGHTMLLVTIVDEQARFSVYDVMRGVIADQFALHPVWSVTAEWDAYAESVCIGILNNERRHLLRARPPEQ